MVYIHWRLPSLRLASLQALLCLLMLLLLPVHSLIPATPGLKSLGVHNIQQQDQPLQRDRRKVSGLDVSSGAIEFMKQLRSTLTDSSGKPTLRNEDDPTNVWCLLDRDITTNVYRPKLKSKKCTAFNHFIYNLSSISENNPHNQLLTQKGMIRAYLQVIPRLLKAHPTPVDITVRAKFLGQERDRFIVAGLHHLDVTTSSNGWVELNITEGLKRLMPQVIKDNVVVEFEIELRVNCGNIKKVPASFVEPTSIKLSQMKRRERHIPLQPFLVVFMNDEEVKTIVRNEQRSNNTHYAESELGTVQSSSSRSKRSAKENPCQMEDFQVSFHELQLYYVLIPFLYNARRCGGSCSHQTLTETDTLATNHAKIMASANVIAKIDKDVIFRHQPRDPCCVPTRYSSITLLVQTPNGGVEYVVYPAMTVEECGCR